MTLLAPQDAARRLRLSTSRLAQLDRAGLLPALRDSAGRRLYESAVVERFALQREQERPRTAQLTDDVPQKEAS
jgi:DNA-binding transcriptional MerR regulator